MKRWKGYIFLVGFLVIINLGNSLDYLEFWDSLIGKVYFVGQVILILLFLAYLRHDYKDDDGLIRKFSRKVKAIKMPKSLKVIVMVIMLVQFIHITLGMTNYPFADVGMFRRAKSPKKKFPETVYVPKYFYYDQRGEVQIVDVRKQHLFFLADKLGLGYNNEFTFSANYHYRGSKANFEFLRDALMKSNDIDTLWVGLHSVNYRTKEVVFDTDLSKAVILNDTAKLFYGPIYIPEYQKNLVTR